jgi:hypothetical protein
MATATVHIAQGLDGKPSLWPVNAVSRDRNGVFKDIRGRIVKAPADRMGVALDSIQPAKRRKPVGKDTRAEDTLIHRLLPMLKRMADESATAEDDADDEQQQYGEVNDEATNGGYAEGMSGYAEAKTYWNGVAERNKAGRGRAYAPVSAAAKRGR